MSIDPRYRSPFSVDHRKPIFIGQDDPRLYSNKLNKYKSRSGSKVYTTSESSNLKTLVKSGSFTTDILLCEAPVVTYTENRTTDDWAWTAVVPNNGSIIEYEYELSFDNLVENVILSGSTADLFLSLASTGGCKLRVRAKCIYNQIFYGDWSIFT